MKNRAYTIVNIVFFAVIATATALFMVYPTVPCALAAGGVTVLCCVVSLLFAIRVKAGGYPAFKWLILAGQLLSFAGGVVFFYSITAGLVLFCLAHAVFIAALCTVNCAGWGDVLPFILLCVGLLCFMFLYHKFSYGRLLPLALIYAVITCALAAKSCGVAFDNTINGKVRVSVLCGGIFMFVSDVFLMLFLYARGGSVCRAMCFAYYFLSLFLFSIALGNSSFCGERRIKAQMNVLKRLYCRAFQFCFKIMIPLLPYRRPTPIENCAKAAKLLKEKCKRRALIVTDKGIVACGLTKPVESALAAEGIEYSVYSETVVNPTIKNAEEAAAMFNNDGCDCIIAVGGGSAMDCAKAAGARIIKPEKSFARMRGVLKVFGKLPLFIAVPTTAGTGSETTIAAVITDGDTRDKFTIISFCLAPHYAILDPQMTIGLPKGMTSTTGMDALTHAVEAYIGGSTTRTTRRYAVQAVSIIRYQLLRAYNDGTDAEARERMQYAAYLAGYAFTVSYVGYVHAVAHSLGGKYNTPHGLANAVILPYVLKRYGRHGQKKLARLSRLSGVSQADTDDKTAADEFIRFVEDMNRAMDIPRKLKVEEGDIPQLAAHADKEANPLYPVPYLMDKKALAAIYYDIKE